MEALERLCKLASTPGDEGEVFDLMVSRWRASGWQVKPIGAYAQTARLPPKWRGRGPKVLITAHTDSPGYAIDCLNPPHAIALGAPTMGNTNRKKATIEAVINGSTRVRLSSDGDDGRAVLIKGLGKNSVIRLGDRVSWAGQFDYSPKTNLIHATFLDNRVGCWLTLKLAETFRKSPPKTFEPILAVTSAEEMTGFGARAVAQKIQPDFVIALDTTYEAKRQGVHLGGGPVLTLSDASVLISRRLRDHICAVFAAHDLPLQTEVYNFSGTDAKAFPPALILPLLIPTKGNHSPSETADWRDILTLQTALETLIPELFGFAPA